MDFRDGVQGDFSGQSDLIMRHAAMQDAASPGCLKGCQ